ncbi:MAG TPA: hypothetical protein VGD56_06080 [Gemmatirosa sp.]
MSRSAFPLVRLLAVAAAPAIAACSSTTDPSTPPLSATEATTVADALFSQAFGGLTASGAFDRSTAGIVALRAPAVRGANYAQTATTTTYAVTAACPLGGNITGVDTSSFGLDSTGTGTVGGSFTYTPHGCVVSAGSRNVTVDGDPSISMSISMPYVDERWSAAATFRMSGGFRWSGGNCVIDYTAVVTPSGSSTITGTVCGQNVSGSYGS